MTCTDASEYYWFGGNVSSCALHNLTNLCPKNVTDDDNFSELLDSPSTFFVQLIKLSLSLAIVTVILAIYSCINVLDRNILSTATCSLYWVIYVGLTALKATLLMLFIPLAHFDPYLINMLGFILTTLIQSALSFTVFIALDHERRFRSPDYASIDSPHRRHCIGINWKRLLWSWPRLAVLVLTFLPLVLLTALEVYFHLNHESAHSALAWVYMASLPLTRIVAIVTTVHLVFFTKGSWEPTNPAKVYITIAMILSLLDDLPSSLLTIAIYQPTVFGTWDQLGERVACTLGVATLYDLFQLLSTFSLLFFVLFVRSQYLRIEQECKLVLVWDLQKLLQVNGRKDVIRHYT